MRLIDADLLQEYCEKAKKEVTKLEDIAQIIGVQAIIHSQPTAYDVDKVGDRLEDYLFEKYCVEGDTKIDEILKSGGIE